MATMVLLVALPWKSPVVILYSRTQGLVEEAFVVQQRILFVGQVPPSFCVVVTRAMKPNHRLALEENRIGYAGESIATSKRVGQGDKGPQTLC